MSYEQNQTWLAEQKCPKCGEPMEHGYITGHWFRLRWNTRPDTKTIFAGTPLRKKFVWMSAPSVEAVRCDKCKVGMFIYDK